MFVSGCYLDWGGGTRDGDGVPVATTCSRLDGQMFLISELRLGQADPAGDPTIVPGANLDGMVSTDADAAGCFHADFTSPAPDDEPGVDNQMGPVLGGFGDAFDVDGGWRDAIVRGELLLLLRLRADGVRCRVEIVRGQLPEGTPALAVDDAGRPAAGQTIDVSASTTVAYDETDGREFRVRTVSAPTLDLPLIAMGAPTVLTILESHVRFSITTAGPSNGVIAGALDVTGLVESIRVLAPDVDEELLRTIFEGQADLARDEMGMCGRVSIALVFETVPAVMGAVR